MFVLLVACGGRVVPDPVEPGKPEATTSAAERKPWTPTPPEPPMRARLTLTGLVAAGGEIGGDMPISHVQYWNPDAPSLRFLGSGPRLYASLERELAVVVLGQRLVEEIHVLIPAISNDGGFEIGSTIDDELAARLTRERCTSGPNPVGGANDVVCRLEGFLVHVEGDLPPVGAWSLRGRKIGSVGVRLHPTGLP